MRPALILALALVGIVLFFHKDIGVGAYVGSDVKLINPSAEAGKQPASSKPSVDERDPAPGADRPSVLGGGDVNGRVQRPDSKPLGSAEETMAPVRPSKTPARSGDFVKSSGGFDANLPSGPLTADKGPYLLKTCHYLTLDGFKDIIREGDESCSWFVDVEAKR